MITILRSRTTNECAFEAEVMHFHQLAEELGRLLELCTQEPMYSDLVQGIVNEDGKDIPFFRWFGRHVSYLMCTVQKDGRHGPSPYPVMFRVGDLWNRPIADMELVGMMTVPTESVDEEEEDAE